MQKSEQLKKVKLVNLKKLSKIENKLFHDFINSVSFGLCQLCSNTAEDHHHPRYGSYGADKDDRCQIAICRKCHEKCHKSKHGMQNIIAENIGDKNWRAYNE